MTLQALPYLDVQLVDGRYTGNVRHLLQGLVPDLLPLLGNLGLDYLNLML